METESMGKRITALRKEKGLTQEQLAEKLGVSAQAVSKWENDVSCPDISILKELAAVLGVSTDELLGAKPLEPRVVVVDAGKDKSQSSGKGFSVHYDGDDKKEGIWFAAVLILIGLAFFLSRTNILPVGAGVSFWNIVWPAVLIGVGVSWFMHDFSPLGFGVALLGLYYLLFHLGATTFVLSWGVIWPVLLVLLGLTILLDKLVPNRKRRHWHGEHTPVSDYKVTDGYVDYDCAFSEENRRVESVDFSGAHIEISFGKSVFDMTGVQTVRPGARIDADVSFGTLEMLVPRTVRVETSADKAFGSVQKFGEPDNNAEYSVQLCGSISFGSLEIRYL